MANYFLFCQITVLDPAIPWEQADYKAKIDIDKSKKRNKTSNTKFSAQ